jgi:hypothetical protein
MYVPPPPPLFQLFSPHSQVADASRFENSSSNYKSNIRSTLYSNSLFTKLEGPTWSLTPISAGKLTSQDTRGRKPGKK